jgi:hypothetical protein
MKLSLSKPWRDLLLGLALLALFYLLLRLLTSCATKPAKPPPKPLAPRATLAAPLPIMPGRAKFDALTTPIPPNKLAMSLPAPYMGTVTLIWEPSPDATVAGYFLYVGLSSGVYSNKMDAGFQTNCTVAGLISSNTYYFVATAYTTNAQLESPFSNEASYTVPPIYAPNAVALSVQGSDNPLGPWVDLGAAWVLPKSAVKQYYRILIEQTDLPPLTNGTWPLKVTIIQTK